MKTDRYKNIIDLPRHVSSNREKMSVYDRAAQFSPFAALKGYDDEIDEAARFTDERIESDGIRAEEINEKLLLIAEQKDNLNIRITYFVADDKKSGGAYVTKEDRVKKLDAFNRKLILQCGTEIAFENIFEIVLI